ncbi:MAG: MoaD/ThiS family protein [Deltaproteobacteria bacterium]|nr:MoaD/ThiS family protein [Deltaproteobacteria bacterium]
MKIKIKYFAFYRDYFKKECEEIVLEKPLNVEDVFKMLLKSSPLKEKLLSSTLFAVNQEYVDKTHVLQEGDELIFVPPVSGG